MKKLFFVLLVLPAWAVSAQENAPEKLFSGETPQRTSVSLVGGPNWLFQFLPALNGGLEPRTGYSLGLDLARRLGGDHWQIKMGFRYNVWKSNRCEGFLFESDYLKGPPYTPTYICTKSEDRAWQYFAGLRWLPGRPKHWRWYADAEVGMTDMASRVSGRALIHFTAGLGTGVQWKPGQHFSVFIQPGARYIFPVKERNLGFTAIPKFLPLHLEMGARWEW